MNNKTGIIFLLLSLASSVIAEEICLEDKDAFTDIKKITGQRCITTSPKNLTMLRTKDDWGKFCLKCNSQSINSLILSNEKQIETRDLYARTAFDDFQKVLTLMTVDFMKMRSSYAFKFDGKKAAESCDISKNLAKPKCFSEAKNKIFESKFNDRLDGIKNALATELSNILTSNSSSNDGLIHRLPKDKTTCNISDKDILFVQARFNETLITPDLIKELNQIDTAKLSLILTDSRQDSSIIKEDTLVKLKELKSHPLFLSLIEDPKKLNEFLKSIDPKDDNAIIISKLYDSKSGPNIGKIIESKCNSLFNAVSKSLEDIYCGKPMPYIADDIESIENAIGTRLKSMNKDEAENHIQLFCADINTRKDTRKSYKEIHSFITGTSDQNLVDQNLTTFKAQSGETIFQKNESKICEAKIKTPPCSDESKDEGCLKLKFLNLSTQSKVYKEMASASSDDINLILRSMVGDGLPQRDGKVDTVSVTLLKTEGILPGAAPTSTPRPQQKDVATFSKAVRSSNNAATSNSSQNTPQVSDSTPATPGMAAPTAPITPTSTSPESSYDTAAAPKKVQELNQNVAKKGMSNEEQAEILRRLRPKNTESTQTAAAERNPSNDTESETEQSSSSASITPTMATAVTAPAIAAASTVIAPANMGQTASAGKQTLSKSAPEKSSYGKAILDANNQKEAVAASVDASGSTSSALASAPTLTATASTKTTDTAKSELTERDYQSKLEVLLNAETKELSVAKDGKSFLVKLKNFQINVIYNEAMHAFVAVCPDKKIPQEYLTTISTYFNQTIEERADKRKALINAFK